MRYFALCLLVIICIALGTAFFDKPPSKRELWDYSQFIQQVEKGNIASVKISPDRKIALVEPKTSDRVIVNLPDDPTLTTKLTSKGVDISILPQSDEKFWFKALQSLLIPIFLLVGLVFLIIKASS
jgi:cell division protease FtsH